MKILHVISGLDPRSGGPPRALYGLARAQKDAGLDVTVVTCERQQGDHSLAQTLRQHGVQVHIVTGVRGRLGHHPGLYPLLHQLAGAGDVLHIHAVWEEIQFLAVKAARSQHKPYLIRPCGMLDPWSLRQSRWGKLAYRWWRLNRMIRHAAAIHFTSDLEAELARPACAHTPAIVEPNGIDLDEFDPLPTGFDLRWRYPACQGKTILLFLSRLHHKKGLDILLPAFAQASDSSAILVIAGPGEEDYLQEVQRIIREHKLDNRVILTGMLHGPDRVGALASADLFVLPSRQENFGIVVVEALAAGTPVLISDQVNIGQDIARHGVGRVLPLDIKAWTQAMQDGRTMQPKTPAMAAAARAYAFDHYAWPRIAHRWQTHYHDILARTR
jgi:glycosyltransferase involved in cell wall biosynthesis